MPPSSQRKDSPADYVEEIRGFRTTNGKMFETKEEAVKHQELLIFRDWCYHNLCRGGEWSADMVADAILEVWDVTPKGT